MEALLHYAWQYRLGALSLSEEDQHTPLEIIDPGEHNLDAGPDFFNAKVRLGSILWAGSVEIHQRSSHWRAHGHHEDAAYNAVILHVVEIDDEPTYTKEGRRVPTATLSALDELRARSIELMARAPQIACSPLGERLPRELIEAELMRLYQERLYDKARQILHLWQQTQDWYETLYITLARSLGFGLNSDAMEQLARSLPLRCIRKQSDRPDQVEALLLGQAGLTSCLTGQYRDHLEREYAFLRRKYDLPTPMPQEQWRRMRTRPYSFPIRRLIQLSCLLRADTFSVDTLLRVDDRASLDRFWVVDVAPSPEGELLLAGEGTRFSRSARLTLSLNVVLPLRLAWAIEQGREHQEWLRLYQLASSLPSESNRYIRLLEGAGICSRHAADGQALLQRYRRYCSEHKCIFCSWGRYLLARKDYSPWRL